ncbi:MAG: 4-hydroxythreonine-4-phosphate dehydrogenase PdxA [Gammaproteobacteria bacterium]|nr:4-hydroxythreonine-4-phosphate dehydrogenase PdxA [Gammaproteobacteria bacterium]
MESSEFIALTAGEPAGIGPDLCLQLAAAGKLENTIVIGDPALFEQRARILGLNIQINNADIDTEIRIRTEALNVLPVKSAKPVTPGKPDTANAEYVLDSIRTAVDACLAGRFSAVVTAPVNKSVINDAGFDFSGHTEFIARRCNTATPVMMLTAGELRVALATTHLPLSEVPAAITPERIETVLSVLAADLRKWFAVENPHILVCGLNPHAGENGHLGREETDIIEPALQRLNRKGIRLTGPIPADTAFTPERLNSIDAVLAMYHDQGLPVLKHSGFGNAVNVTLGLPIIRTSVDHGTAFELAGTGTAGTSSLAAAIQCARDMAANAA